MRHRTRTALAAALLTVAAPVALAHAAPGTGQTAHAKQSKVSLLFVFEGQSAQMAPVEGQAGTYTFTMPIRTAKQPVIWFTDRPARHAGTLSMRNFVGLWSAPGTNTFPTDPPNVAIAYTSGGKQKTFIATMTSPVIIPPTATPGTAKLQATMTAVPEAQLATYAKGEGNLAKHAKNAQRNPNRSPASSVIARTPSVFVDNVEPAMSSATVPTFTCTTPEWQTALSNNTTSSCRSTAPIGMYQNCMSYYNTIIPCTIVPFYMGLVRNDGAVHT